jgi:hypothetical protein
MSQAARRLHFNHLPVLRIKEIQENLTMADFCQQCATDTFGEDTRDLAGLITEQEVTEQKLYAVVLCEGCGPTLVDHNGKCVCDDCLEKHGAA